MVVQTLETQLSQILRSAISRLSPEAAVPEALLRWDMPKDPSFGDVSSAAAFKLAASLRQPPPRLAEALAEAFVACSRQTNAGEAIDRAEANAGFLNVFLSPSALIETLTQALEEGGRFGHCRRDPSPLINIEFVSANPTGPLSLAHGRQAGVGDVLARLLRSQGFRVTTEYYLNDEGRQIEMLGRSLRARYLQALGRDEPFPEDGYHGSYVTESAARLIQQHGDRWADQPLEAFMAFGMDEQLAEIRRVLARFNLVFDVWTSQQWVRTSGRIDAALKALREAGAVYDAEEAMWFRSTAYGDDKDRVIKKRNGELTYLAPDIAYHQFKFERKYDQILNLWGPDHHGYIARVKAAVAALGLPAERLTVKIVQLVTLSRHGAPVPMSKRAGEFVTFEEVLDEVGVDATRFFFVMRTMESHLDFDLELAAAQSQENPVYYVQYAHARICSILAKANGAPREPSPKALERLAETEERLLLRAIVQYPMVLRLCAASLEPHGLTIYLRKLAETFHVFYTKHRVISEDQELTAARLGLIRAAQQVLANGLGLLGISAPTRM
ncbi:MAG: arginine--tRNA ligase [Candidatus Omnitrophica bacterium]|nr:arginine--tRNA ligase [Candidatus Omnitrophota bacterium]